MKAKRKKKRTKSVYDALGQEIKKELKKGQRPHKIEIGKMVVKLRKDRGMRSVDLCHASGDLDPKTLNALEKGRIKNPTIKTLQSVSRGLGIDVADLFRQFESKSHKYFFQGTQKGAYQVTFPPLGVKAVSFTPFIESFFCGKLILGPKKRLEETLLNHPFPIFATTLIGRFDVMIEDRKLSLREGENVFFHGHLRHSFHNPLRRESALMMITAPSFFK